MILDLSGLQFIDSTGLSMLLTNFNDAAHNGWQLQVDPNLTSQVRRVVELVGLDLVMNGCLAVCTRTDPCSALVPVESTRSE